MDQRELSPRNCYEEITEYLREKQIKKILMVAGGSFEHLEIAKYWKRMLETGKIDLIRFGDFKPNPEYESVEKGVALFRQEKCDMIVAVGGGSAIDVAKCIKMFSNMDPDKNYLDQTITPNDIPFMVMPTTAGTGSEATRFAVIYYRGEKQSVSDYSCIPDAVIFDPTCLYGLPLYHKKASMLDALCHAIESMWSINSTDESMAYSEAAIKDIMSSYRAYLDDDKSAAENMLFAANTAGKAINITQTTAGHAMCYKLTSLYGLAHGHAAALCVSVLFPFMAEHMDKCVDPRGEGHLHSVFLRIAKAFGCDSIPECKKLLCNLVDSLELERPMITADAVGVLLETVNPVRLKNNPVELSRDDIRQLYCDISKGKDKSGRS